METPLKLLKLNLHRDIVIDLFNPLQLRSILIAIILVSHLPRLR